MFKRSIQQIRNFHSVYHADVPILDPTKLEVKLLSKAYTDHVPKLGFNEKSVYEAAKDLKLNPNNLNGLFQFTTPSKDLSMELVLYHLRASRAKLVGYRTEANNLANESDRIRFLLKKRLLDNSPVVAHLGKALGLMVMPSNLGCSLEELHKLSDDVSFYSGDRSNDFAWYSKRFSLSGVFVQSELFMLSDKSDGFEHTVEFMNDRVDEVDKLAYAYNSFEEWAIFNAHSTVNLIKSQIARG
ncbi:unnamed protein product [Ambrosiozyma monospora]|uniref:Ubiquinone biosynthesis protein n=1 Tax=Ambrosiozyma monospora TaxID=43982 RepID=A0A9W6YPF5_AMBMO|nr:unnamed protein product [Ambrosiozyma monospora]